MDPNVIVTIIIAILCIINPKSPIGCIIFFCFMWTLWAFNVWNGDYVAYMENYNNPNTETIEVGYQIFNKICSAFMPFQGFMILISSIILALFCLWGIKYTKYPSLFAVIYFPMFILEYVYIRNYISLVIIFYALFRLIYENGNKKISVLLILLASSIHIFSICYLPIVLFLKSKINYKRLITLVLIVSLAVILLSYTVIFSSTYLSSKAELYAREGGNSISLTTPFHILIVYISYYIFKNSKFCCNVRSSVLRCFVNYNILSLIFIPVYYILPYAASRSLRSLIIINLFFYFYIFAHALIRTKFYSRLGLIFLCICIGYMFSMQKFDYVLEPLYKCNLLWGYNASYQLFNY